ncbi:hypothetical protein DPMN_177986 [Dreissena polymorpha]|uniref:Uncharacterized protein n=1 Tax=Dreissena polymorpha TaxID=45954 RepID=A0A9D4IL13_DREPO|nr:hypothetical protein DPMN_177986 [Dreissena polymorpha]
MKNVTSIVYTSDLKNILTKFHKDWMKNMTSTVYTNKLLTDTRTHTRTPDITRSHKLTMSLCDGFELNQDIIRTNLRTKLHEDQTKKCKMLTTDDRQSTKSDPKSSP